MNHDWIKRSQFIMRAAIGASLVGLVMAYSHTSQSALKRAIDALEAHSEWSLSEFNSLARAENSISETTSEYDDIVRYIARLNGIELRSTDTKYMIHTTVGELVAGQSSFHKSRTLREYVTNLSLVVRDYPVFGIPVEEDFSDKLHHAFRSLKEFSPILTAYGSKAYHHKPNVAQFSMHLEFPDTVSQEEVEIAADIDFGIRQSHSESRWKAEFRFDVSCRMAESLITIVDWQRTKSKPDVPMRKGGIDTRVLNDAAEIVGDKEPVNVLAELRDKVADSERIYQVLSMSISFPSQSWLVAIIIVVLQLYALMHVIGGDPGQVKWEELKDSVWPVVRAELVYKSMFIIESLVPVYALYEISSKHGPNYIYTFTIASLIVSGVYIGRMIYIVRVSKAVGS